MQRRIVHSILGISFASVLAILPTIGLANVRSQMPDPYAEPGLNPFRDQVSANASEFIDPFSGVLHLRHVDLFIPGNGGLDIKIQRTYNSNAVYLSRKTPANIAPNLTQHPARTPYDWAGHSTSGGCLNGYRCGAEYMRHQ